MMIAFITKSSLPLIEDLCSSDSISIQVLGFTFHLLLCFFGRKNIFNKKACSPDLIPPFSLYIHMCTLYIYTNRYMPRFSPSDVFRPRPLSSHWVPYVQCMCVCAYTHAYTHVCSHHVRARPWYLHVWLLEPQLHHADARSPDRDTGMCDCSSLKSIMQTLELI